MKLKLAKNKTVYLVALAIWLLFLLFGHSHWINFILLPVGAVVGYLILEINWNFPNKEVVKILPLILLPLTLFILTSTSGAFGKAVVVFFNLRLFLDKTALSKDN